MFFPLSGFSVCFSTISIVGSLAAYLISTFCRNSDIFNENILYGFIPFLVASTISSKFLSSLYLNIFINTFALKKEKVNLHEFSVFRRKLERINILKEKVHAHSQLTQRFHERCIFFIHNITTPLSTVKNIISNSISGKNLITNRDKLLMYSCIEDIILQSKNYMNLHAKSDLYALSDIFLVQDVVERLSSDFKSKGVVFPIT